MNTSDTEEEEEEEGGGGEGGGGGGGGGEGEGEEEERSCEVTQRQCFAVCVDSDCVPAADLFIASTD